MFDTNIYVSAFAFERGVPHELFRHALRRHFVLLASPAILHEVANVLRYKFGTEESSIVSRMKLVVRVARMVSPVKTIAVFAGAMEPDNRILECAVEGKAGLIVSGDRDLQRLRAFEDIPIVRPGDALRMMQGRE